MSLLHITIFPLGEQLLPHYWIPVDSGLLTTGHQAIVTELQALGAV